jgi:hypothetical protein
MASKIADIASFHMLGRLALSAIGHHLIFIPQQRLGRRFSAIFVMGCRTIVPAALYLALEGPAC